MALLTNFLKLFKWNTEDESDLEQEFDIDQAMNENWDKIDKAIEDLDTNKVDKVDGKGLSTNDFTNEDKEKLDGLENYDDTEITQEIEDIQEEQAKQNEDIEDLKQNDAKQDDLIQKLKDNSINITTEEATQLHVEDASELPAKLEVRGNHTQKTVKGIQILENTNQGTTGWAMSTSPSGLGVMEEVSYLGTRACKFKTTAEETSWMYISRNVNLSKLKNNTTYTLQMDVKTNYNEGTINIYIQDGSATNTLVDFGYVNNVNGERRIKLVATTNDTEIANQILYIGLYALDNNSSNELIITNLILVEGDYSDTELEWEEYTGLQGSPSLDYPSEVEAVGDNGSVEIKKLTENVIDLSKSVALYNTEITEIDKENGIIKVHRTNTQDPSIQIFCNLPAGQYTMLHNSHNFGQVSVYGKNKIVDIGSEKYKIFNATENITDIRIYSGSELPTDYEINFSDIILVMGNVAREDIKYVKYQESSYILDIQKPMLSGDYFVKEADGWKEVHCWGKVVLTGNENNWSWNTDNLQRVSINVANGLNNQSRQMIYSNNFIYGASGSNVGIGFLYASRLFLYYPENITSLEDWKALLQEKYNSGNPVYVYYPLATSTKLPCTEAQSNILDQLNELELFKGTNNIITTEGLALMQMQYIADTETYIDNRIDEKLANINQQILKIAGGN